MTNEIRLGTCACVFKDAHCRYIGDAIFCDYTLRRCRELGNESNFRGGLLQPLPDDARRLTA
jgi:hypothetical protein